MFELTLSLTKDEEDVKGLACELMCASLLLEVWHQIPKHGDQAFLKEAVEDPHGPKKDVVVGRRLGPSFQDILLGVAHVPLVHLLSYTGNLCS